MSSSTRKPLRHGRARPLSIVLVGLLFSATGTFLQPKDASPSRRESSAHDDDVNVKDSPTAVNLDLSTVVPVISSVADKSFFERNKPNPKSSKHIEDGPACGELPDLEDEPGRHLIRQVTNPESAAANVFIHQPRILRTAENGSESSEDHVDHLRLPEALPQVDGERGSEIPSAADAQNHLDLQEDHAKSFGPDPPLAKSARPSSVNTRLPEDDDVVPADRIQTAAALTATDSHVVSSSPMKIVAATPPPQEIAASPGKVGAVRNATAEVGGPASQTDSDTGLRSGGSTCTPSHAFGTRQWEKWEVSLQRIWVGEMQIPPHCTRLNFRYLSDGRYLFEDMRSVDELLQCSTEPLVVEKFFEERESCHSVICPRCALI